MARHIKTHTGSKAIHSFFVLLVLVGLIAGVWPVGPAAVSAEEPEPINWAAAKNGGRIISADAERDDWPASNLLDGYKLDYGEWQALSLDFPITVVVELGGDGPHVIDHVVLNPWTSEWRLAWVRDFELRASATSPEPGQMTRIGEFTLARVGIDQTFTFDPIEAKYVALMVESNHGNTDGVLLNEFEVYNAPEGAAPVQPEPAQVKPDNLVAADNGGRIVAVSSEDASGSWPASKLIDSRNHTSTGWSSAGIDPPQYVVFGLAGDQPRTVERVTLNPYSNDYEEDWVRDFELRASLSVTDIGQMTSLGKFTLKQVGEDQTFTFAPTQLRYIAFIPLSNYGGSAFALNEFEVYAASGKRPRPVRPTQFGEPVAPAALVAAATLTSTLQTSWSNKPIPPQQGPKPPGPTPTVASPPVSIDNLDIQLDYTALVPLTYHLYGTFFQDLVSLTFTNNNPFSVTVRSEVTVPDYTQPDIKTVMLEPGETYTMLQNPTLMPSVWGLLDQNRDASLRIKIEHIIGQRRDLIYEETYPLLIYARNNFPWNVPGFYNGTVFLATMVTPNDPKVDELLRRAADYSPTDIITFDYGDETDSDHSVWNRMKAIYQAIASYNVIYVAAGVDFVPIEARQHGFTMQRLKFPSEVLTTSAGMCVEMSALYASALEYILLDPVLLTVPGHVYVACPISRGSDTFYFVETTVVNQRTFEEAVQIAAKNWTENDRAQMETDRLDLYYWLDVKQARLEGITPTPFR